MTILLITPGSTVRHSGNRCTASQWADLLKKQGHEVVVCYDIPETFPLTPTDLLLAMHGARCHDVIARYRKEDPAGKILLALTGTDIYPTPSAATIASMAAADGLIVLQERAVEVIPSPFRAKTTVVIQSVSSKLARPPRTSPYFEVCVVGHLREVKNPLLAASASRLLPPESRLRIRHAGGILESKYETLIAQEQGGNSRYRWLGELSSEAVIELLISSDLMVLSSHHEGGARVVGEAIVHGTPVLSTRIEGIVGLLGASYPGFFPDNDDAALAAMLWKSESDPAFYAELQAAAAALAPRFDPVEENRALGAAIAALFR